MTFSQWLFGGIDNPYKNGRWGLLHIMTLLVCVGCVVGFYFLVKHAKNKDRTRNIIVNSLAGAILFFEVMIRFVYFMKLYYFHQEGTESWSVLWIMIPKPWCAISCWALIACVFVKKAFFYNYASLSALLCSFIFFCYPGVGYNNEILLFDNWYSILTHALLLTTSLTLVVLKFTAFKYKDIWKLAICFVLTYAYGLLQIYVLHTQDDPMYFMPDGDIQADILHISYGLYLTLYILLIVIYVNAFHLIDDRATVKKWFASWKIKE